MEYRIGNYVWFTRKGSTAKKVTMVHKNGLKAGMVSQLYNKIYSIPLTVEWLEKLGFEFYKPLGHYRIVINDIWVQVNLKEYVEGEISYVFTFTNLNYDETEHMPRKVVKYVHKLQNLFYEIMDVELPYKE